MSQCLYSLLLAFALIAPVARAASVPQCTSTVKKAKKACDDTVKKAIADSQTRGVAAAAGSKDSVQKQVGALTDVTTQSNQDLQAAIKTCDEQKSKCDSDCDSKAASDSDKPTLDSQKKSCDEAIAKNQKQAQDGIDGGQSALGKAGETGDKAAADKDKEEKKDQVPWPVCSRSSGHRHIPFCIPS